MENRNKKFFKNSFISLLQQLVAIISGLILPQLMLSFYGSNINGVISSINQFLSFITILQGGIGTVARIAFYKPLAENDEERISIAYRTVTDFFRKFSFVFIVYLILLSIIYPFFVNTGLSHIYISLLVLILGLASVSEYFFGQSSQLLLYSDQKGYIYSITQIICLFFSTLLGVIMIYMNYSVHIVKLVYALIFIIRPIILYTYVKKHYKINRKSKIDKNLLAQRKSAWLRHIAFYIHTSTDIIVLTLFTNVLWVSVYSIYKYVINCLSNLLMSILGNSEVIFGDMIARNENDTMKSQIPMYDLLTKYLSVACFSTCMILIIPFIKLYTKNVNDFNYIYPIFAFTLIFAEMVYCMGSIYQNVYIAAGHIKNTEKIAITEAVLNMIISIVLVGKLKILGVAIGTLIAMIYKNIANIIYMKKNVFDMSGKFIIKNYIVNILSSILLIIIFNKVIFMSINSYIDFFVLAFVVFIIVCSSLGIINFIFFKKDLLIVLYRLKGRLHKKNV